MDRQNHLPVADSVETALLRHGATPEMVSRCRALELTHSDVATLLELASLHDRPLPELVTYLEQGFALNRMVSSLHLQANSETLQDCSLPSICRSVELISFHATDLQHDLATGKLLYHGKALTPRQIEQEMLAGITGEGANDTTQREYLNEPYEAVLEPIVEMGHGLADDPLDAMLNVITQFFDGNVMLVWQLITSSPDLFKRFLEGQVGVETLRELMIAYERGEIDLPKFEADSYYWEDTPDTEEAIESLALYHERAAEIAAVAKHFGKWKGKPLLVRLDLGLDDEDDPKAVAKGLGLNLRRYRKARLEEDEPADDDRDEDTSSSD